MVAYTPFFDNQTRPLSWVFSGLGVGISVSLSLSQWFLALVYFSCISSMAYPSGSFTKAITVEPPLTGPGARLMVPPWAAMASQVA